jgi:hypothetical protein
MFVLLSTDFAIRLTIPLFKGTSVLASTGFLTYLGFLVNGFLTFVGLTLTFYGAYGSTSL